MSDSIVRVRDVKKLYRMGAETVHALGGVSLEVRRGEYVSIMGPSGSGKSTLFNMIGGLDRPTDGDVFIEGYRLRDLSSRQLAWVRCHKIGFVFQSFNLIPTMTALENVAIARVFFGKKPSEANRDAAETLARVGLGERMHHLPSEVSGGQQQRIAIARALVNHPDIILADEPTGNLDLHTGEDIIRMIGDMQQNLGITVITATHDMKMLSASDKVVWIKDGKVDRIAGKGEVDIEIGTIDGNALA